MLGFELEHHLSVCPCISFDIPFTRVPGSPRILFRYLCSVVQAWNIYVCLDCGAEVRQDEGVMAIRHCGRRAAILGVLRLGRRPRGRRDREGLEAPPRASVSRLKQPAPSSRQPLRLCLSPTLTSRPCSQPTPTPTPSRPPLLILHDACLLGVRSALHYTHFFRAPFLTLFHLGKRSEHHRSGQRHYQRPTWVVVDAGICACD